MHTRSLSYLNFFAEIFLKPLETTLIVEMIPKKK